MTVINKSKQLYNWLNKHTETTYVKRSNKPKLKCDGLQVGNHQESHSDTHHLTESETYTLLQRGIKYIIKSTHVLKFNRIKRLS